MRCLNLISHLAWKSRFQDFCLLKFYHETSIPKPRKINHSIITWTCYNIYSRTRLFHIFCNYISSIHASGKCVCLLNVSSFHSAVRRDKTTLSLDSWGLFSPIFVLLLFSLLLIADSIYLFSLLGCVWQSAFFLFPSGLCVMWGCVCFSFLFPFGLCVIGGRGWWGDVLTRHVGK